MATYQSVSASQVIRVTPHLERAAASLKAAELLLGEGLNEDSVTRAHQSTVHAERALLARGGTPGDLDRLLWVRARDEREALRSGERLLRTEGFELVVLDLFLALQLLVFFELSGFLEVFLVFDLFLAL